MTGCQVIGSRNGLGIPEAICIYMLSVAAAGSLAANLLELVHQRIQRRQVDILQYVNIAEELNHQQSAVSEYFISNLWRVFDDMQGRGQNTALRKLI